MQPSLVQVGRSVLTVMLSWEQAEFIFLKIKKDAVRAMIDIKIRANNRSLSDFFIRPRKLNNKGTIYILKIRQSMQTYKKIKKVEKSA